MTTSPVAHESSADARWRIPIIDILACIQPLRPENESPVDSLQAFAHVAWSYLVEPGDRIAGAMVRVLGAGGALDAVVNRTPAHAIADHCGHDFTESEAREALDRWESRLDAPALFRSLAAAARLEVQIVVPTDTQWPEGVNDLGDHAPHALWVRGKIDALPSPERSVAIVGARASTGYGEHVAMDFAASLSQRGLTVVSGGAYGIDGMAHRAALAVGSPTVAVLAGGVDQLYPAGHDELLRRIMTDGAVVSEVPCGGAPTRWRFLQRNRVIAAMAGATVVIEAGHRSGSLNTATHARDLDRPLGVVPGPITSASSAGCHRLLRENFAARVVTSAADICELLSGDGEAVPFDTHDAPEVLQVIDSLSGRAPRTVADIAHRSGLAAAVVMSTLGALELDGRVTRRDEGWTAVSRR